MKIDIEKLKKIEEACGSFDIGRIIGGGNYNYLRFGYWKPTDWETLQNILAPTIVVEEDSDYDDDCGWKYSFKTIVVNTHFLIEHLQLIHKNRYEKRFSMVA